MSGNRTKTVFWRLVTTYLPKPPKRSSNLQRAENRSRDQVPQAPFEHPDAQRQFRVVENVEELFTSLEYPLDKWSIFLHPTQRDLSQAKVSQSRSRGRFSRNGQDDRRLHREVYLARAHPESRVLLATFLNH